MGSGAVYVVNPAGGYPYDLTLVLRVTEISTGANNIVVIGTVPSGKAWCINAIGSWNATATTPNKYIGVNSGGTYAYLNYGASHGVYTMLTWAGSIWLQAGMELIAVFNGIAAGQSLTGLAIGGQISI